ncbi:Mite allergen group-7 [Trinorchestia longiramus]|nr:Mite allergen group-7 [Trinorchestia longiramus]
MDIQLAVPAFRLDTYQSGFKGSATINYNVLHDRLSISDLKLDVFFEELEAFISGSYVTVSFKKPFQGNIVKAVEILKGLNKLSLQSSFFEGGQSIFDAVWGAAEPIFSQAVEDVINHAFENISISELIPTVQEGELGNANLYLEMVIRLTDQLLLDTGMDPLHLPDSTLDLGSGNSAELRNNTLTGLSTLRRSGTATVDTVSDWHFLYANIAVGPLQARYNGNVVDSDGTTDSFDASVTLEVVDVYMTARADSLSGIFDLDQFVISNLGPVDVEINGLGALGWLAETLTEALTNLFMDEIQATLSQQVKNAIQEVLNENPWPPQ